MILRVLRWFRFGTFELRSADHSVVIRLSGLLSLIAGADQTLMVTTFRLTLSARAACFSRLKFVSFDIQTQTIDPTPSYTTGHHKRDTNCFDLTFRFTF